MTHQTRGPQPASWRRRVGGLLLALAATGASAQLTVSIETVALSDDPAGGTGADFQLFQAALINDTGKVAFHARLSNLDETVWLWDPVGGLQLQSQADFLGIDRKSLRVSNLGVGHGRNDSVDEIWGPDAGGSPQLLASDGASAPGGGTFDLSSSDEEDILLSNAGLALFTRIDDGSNLHAVFRQGPGLTLQEVFRQGDPAPGAGGDTFVAFTDGVINDSGELVFEANLDLVGTRGLFGPGGTATTLLLRTGDEPPGVPGGQFRGFGTSSDAQGVNNARQIAFNGNMNVGPGGVTALDAAGVWGPAVGGSSFRLVARTGFAAAEAGGAVWSGFDSLVLNAAGSTAFEGGLTGVGVDSTNNTGLWAARIGQTPRLAVRTGAATAGFPGSVLAPAFEFNYGLNAADQLVFAAELDTGGYAIWLYDLASDTLEPLIGPGAVVDVAAGDSRLVETAWFGSATTLEAHSGGEDGKKSVWNDARQAAAILEFTDGSHGVFRLTVDTGVCAAADGESLVLSNDIVVGSETYEVCDTLTVGPNYQVAGPNGRLTLRAGELVILGEGTSVGIDGELTVETDPAL